MGVDKKLELIHRLVGIGRVKGDRRGFEVGTVGTQVCCILCELVGWKGLGKTLKVVGCKNIISLGIKGFGEVAVDFLGLGGTSVRGH